MMPSTDASFAPAGADVHVRVLVAAARGREHRRMYLMIEAWTPKPAWLALTEAQRADYVAGVGEGVAALAAQGVRPLGWGLLDDAARATEHTAFAVWECGSRAGCDALREAIAAAGWYELFDQVDFGGEAGPPDAVLRHHIELAAA
jgi:hypothetical protein